MEEQLLKDFIATAQQYNYDYDVVMPKFPELANVDLQILKDYIATAESNNYDYDLVNSKFPELEIGVKKKGISEPVGDTEGTMASSTEQAPASPFFLDSQSSDPIAERGIGFEEPVASEEEIEFQKPSTFDPNTFVMPEENLVGDQYPGDTRTINAAPTEEITEFQKPSTPTAEDLKPVDKVTPIAGQYDPFGGKYKAPLVQDSRDNVSKVGVVDISFNAYYDTLSQAIESGLVKDEEEFRKKFPDMNSLTFEKGQADLSFKNKYDNLSDEIKEKIEPAIIREDGEIVGINPDLISKENLKFLEDTALDDDMMGESSEWQAQTVIKAILPKKKIDYLISEKKLNSIGEGLEATRKEIARLITIGLPEQARDLRDNDYNPNYEEYKSLAKNLNDSSILINSLEIVKDNTGMWAPVSTLTSAVETFGSSVITALPTLAASAMHLTSNLPGMPKEVSEVSSEYEKSIMAFGTDIKKEWEELVPTDSDDSVGNFIGNVTGQVAFIVGSASLGGLPAAAAAGYTMSTSEMYSEAMASGLSHDDAMYLSMTYGAVSAPLEMLGAGKAIQRVTGVALRKKIIQAALKNGVASFTKEVADKAVKASFKPIIIAALKESGQEGFQEGTQYLISKGLAESYNNWMREDDDAEFKKTNMFAEDGDSSTFGINNKFWVEFWQNVGLGAAGGTIGGASISVMQGNVYVGSNYKFIEKMLLDPKQMAKINDQLTAYRNDGTIKTDEELQVIKERVGIIQEAAAQVDRATKANPESFGVEQQKKTFALVAERMSAEKEIEGMMPILAETKKAEIETIDNKIRDIASGKITEAQLIEERTPAPVVEAAPVAEEIVTETAPVVEEAVVEEAVAEEAVVEEAVAEEAVVEEVAAKTRQENISERSNKKLFEDQRSSKELPYNKGKDGKGRADIYDITKPDEKGVATAQYASPDGSVDIIVSAKNDKNFVGYTRIYENGEPTNMFTAKMESTGDAFKNMITSAEAKLPDNAEVVEETSISEGGLKVYNKSNLTEKLDEDGNVVTRPTKYSAATKESVKQDGQSAYLPFTTTDKTAAEAEVVKIEAAYPGIKATIIEGKSAPLRPSTPGQKKTAPSIPAKKERYLIDIDLPVLIKSQKTKTEAVAEEAAMSKKVGASINEEEAEKAAPVETTTEEITIFRGLQPKRDVKGKPKTVHKIKKGKFGSAKIEGTDGNKGTKPIKKFTIPAGTTVETVKLPGNTPAATSRVALETEAIDNSTAQVVKLETIDAGGRETQYIIKDDSLLESGVDMTAEEEASARSKPKKKIISDERSKTDIPERTKNRIADIIKRENEKTKYTAPDTILKKVVANVQSRDPWYEEANDTQREDTIRYIRKVLGIKEKRKGKVAKDIEATVFIEKKNVTVDEMASLKDQIKVLDRGAKTAKKSIETATKNLAAEVKELVKKGKINVSQMTSVMNKFSKVDMFKEEKIEEFVDYMTKVFNDADYANKIIKAKSVVEKIKKQSKKGEVTISTAGKEFAKINPSLVDDIDLFLEQADKVLQGLRKTTKSDLAKGNTKETFNIKEVNEYVSSTIESQDKKIYDAKRKTFHNTTGIDPSELTLKEMDSLLNKLTGKELTEEQKAKESKDKSEIIDKAAKNAFANFSESVSIGIKDGSIKVSKDTKKTIGKFLKIDLALLNTEKKILAIDAIINFKTNPEATGGMGALLDQYKGNKGMFDLFKQNIAANTRSTGTGEIWSINLSTLPLAIESYFKSQSKALKVMDKIGIDGVVNGSAKAETDANKLTEVYAKKFKKKKMKKGKYFDDFNEIERGVLAFVRRTVSGTIEEKKIEFNRRKKMVKETYVELLKSTDNVSKKTGELIEASYDKLVAKSENYNEVDKKADPVNLEGVEHVSKDWENLYPDLASVALDYYNINLGKDLNFTPDNLVLTGKEDTKSDIDKPIYNPDPGLRDEESGRLKENKRINALPKGRILSLGFDTQNYRNLKDAMTDINTAPSIKQIKGAMDSKYFEKVFVNESSRRVIKDRIYKYVELKRGKDFETPLNKNILRKLGRTTALGVRMVLGGATQPIKQIVPLSNTIVNAGIVNTTAAAKLMLDKEVRDAVNNSGLPIANRGASSQGDIESVNSRIKNTTENIINKGITKIDQLNKYIIDKTLVYTDVAVAKTSFVAYYIKAMKKNGVEASDIDWTKPLDKEAGAYAMQQVNRQQNVSDSDLQGAFFTDKKIVTQLVRKTAFTFANFLINQKTRTYSDINTLFRNPTANKGDKAAALRSLGGLGVETIAFNAVGLALNEGITAIHYALKGEDESEEEKEKRRKNQIKGKAGNIVKDLISPIPLLDDFVVGAANLALELMADPEDEDPFQLFSNDTKTFVQRMGVLGIPLQKLSNLYEMGRIVATGEIENEYMGKKTTKKVSDENIDYMRTVAPIYLLYISGGLGLSEIGYMSEKALKEVKRSKELGFAKSSVADIKEFAPDLYDDLKQLKDELKDLEVDID